MFGICIPETVFVPFLLLLIKPLLEILGVWKFVIGEEKKPREIKAVPIDIDEDEIYDNMDWDAFVSSSKYTFVKYTADWCAPCRTIEPIYEVVKERYMPTVQNARFVVVDVTKCPKVAAVSGVLKLPTLRCYRYSKLLAHSNPSSEESIEDFFEQALNI